MSCSAKKDTNGTWHIQYVGLIGLVQRRSHRNVGLSEGASLFVELN